MRRQNWRLCLLVNICRHYGDRGEIWDYSSGIAQIDDEIEEKLNFRICPKSTISLLASRYDMPILPCFPIGGMKKQHDAILESFGTIEDIIISLTRLPSTTCSPLPSSPFTLKNFEISSSLALLDLRNYTKSNSDLAAKSLFSKLF